MPSSCHQRRPVVARDTLARATRAMGLRIAVGMATWLLALPLGLPLLHERGEPFGSIRGGEQSDELALLHPQGISDGQRRSRMDDALGGSERQRRSRGEQAGPVQR